MYMMLKVTSYIILSLNFIFQNSSWSWSSVFCEVKTFHSPPLHVHPKKMLPGSLIRECHNLGPQMLGVVTCICLFAVENGQSMSTTRFENEVGSRGVSGKGFFRLIA